MKPSRPALILLALLASAALSTSCGERLGDYDQENDGRLLACAPISVSVQVGDGTMWLLDENLEHDWWCTCITEDELDDELREWVNERAYATCVAFVEELGYDPELSTCAEHYDAGDWGGPWGFPYSPFDEFRYCDELGELHPRLKVE